MQSLLFDSRMNDSCELILFSESKTDNTISVVYSSQMNHSCESVLFSELKYTMQIV